MTMMLNISNNLSPYYDQFQIIHRVWNKITLPYIFFIAIVGLITNISTVILLSNNVMTKNLKNKWTLIALALSDLLFNITLLSRGINDVFKGRSAYFCLLLSFLSHLAEFLSACYTVSFTIQRYTAVRYPLRTAVHRHSSPIISLLFIFISCSLFCFVLSNRNAYVECHEELKLSWFIGDALVSFVIPFSLILIYNILIVNFIRKHSRSPISVQSTLRRKKKHLKNNNKTSHDDDTYEIENITGTNVIATYTHTGENEIVDLNKERTSSIETEQHIKPASFSSDRMQYETSPNLNHSRVANHGTVSSKNSSINKQCHAADILLYRLAEKSPNQSNDREIFTDLSTRTSQSIRVTRMLILVSTCFLILNAPAHLCLIALSVYTKLHTSMVNDGIEFDHFQHINNLPNNHSNNFIFINETTNQTSSFEHESIVEDKLLIHILYMAVSLTQLIAFASYSLNFFLYSFSGIAFRTSLRQIINKFRRH